MKTPLQERSYNYQDVGITQTADTRSYLRDEHQRSVGTGPQQFERLAAGLLDWQLQRRAGLKVVPAAEALAGLSVHQYLRLGPLRVDGPVRVIDVVRDAASVSLRLGALEGHPEAGEELFHVDLLDDNVVLTLVIVSRPARWFSILGGPVARALQRRMHQRYVAAAVDICAQDTRKHVD